MLDIKTSSNCILKDGKPIIKLEADAIDSVLIDHVIVILMKKVPEDTDRNIVCYDFEGKFRWRVSSPLKIHSENYYVGIELRDNQLYAYSISGIEHLLNPNTGEILETELVK
jgi:hypothetical protein